MSANRSGPRERWGLPRVAGRWRSRSRLSANRSGPRERWGLPRVAGRWRFVGANLIDSLGSGVFLPLSVVFFVRTTSLPLTTVGACLSVAALVGTAAVPLTGPAVDRLGPGRSMALSGLLQAVGFLGYLGVDAAWHLVGCAALVHTGQNLYWTASGPAVLAVALPGEADRWFSLLRMLRNLGLGAGTLLASTLALSGESAGRTLVLVNALSFVAAAWLAASALPGPPPAPPEQDAGGGPGGSTERAAGRAGRRAWGRTWGRTWGRGYLPVLRDPPFVALTAANVLLALCTLVMPVILTVYVTADLALPDWFVGALFTANAALVAGTQTAFSRLLERLPPVARLHGAAGLWAVCFAGLWLASPASTGVAMLLAGGAVVCFTLAEMAHAPTVSGETARLAPPALRGRYFAVHQLSWSVPAIVAPAAFTRLHDLGAPWLWSALLAACLGGAVLLRLTTSLRAAGRVGARRRSARAVTPSPSGGGTPSSRR
ncbi:MFS transporter [Streptomyces sp. B6B3]|uniref:MFS transporter n=1 Tax=Streptomyces sp. B6B3 TaxID=3153570 RepID=UPI00325DB5F3